MLVIVNIELVNVYAYIHAGYWLLQLHILDYCNAVLILQAVIF